MALPTEMYSLSQHCRMALPFDKADHNGNAVLYWSERDNLIEL